MIVRQIRYLAAVLVVCFAGSEFATAGTAKAKNDDVKFQRDLESLFGAVVKTKHGEMAIRQRKDANGRVRKQIIAGPGFSEIQLDQDGDGTVDFWEVTNRDKTVAASHPSRGRFMRLAVTRRLAKGITESTYVLNLNGRSYDHLKTSFVGKDVRFRTESVSEENFTPEDPPRATAEAKPDPVNFSSSAVPTTASVADRNAEVSIDDPSWIQHQIDVLGEDYTCEVDGGTTRLSDLQRDWWKILKNEVDGKQSVLVEKLKSSEMFDASCKTSARREDFDKLVDALATVMMSSSKGEPSSNDRSRGRFLRCLERSGMGVTAARMEKAFLAGLNDPYQTEAPIRCDWTAGKTVSTPADMDPSSGQIAIHAPAFDGPNDGPKQGKNKDHAPQNYQNILLHEFIHVGGVFDEDTAHAAQACCGDPSEFRVVACAKLDRIAVQEKRFKDLETFLLRVSEGEKFGSYLHSKFGADDANKLNRAFLLGLDNYKKGSPPQGKFVNGLLSQEDFSKCAALYGEPICRTKWYDEIQNYTDSFFAKECKKVASGANRKTCKQVSEESKSAISRSIADALLAPTAREPGQQQCKISSKSRAASLFEVASSYFSKWMFGTDAVAFTAEVDCGDGPVNMPPVPTPNVGVADPDEALSSMNPGDSLDGAGVNKSRTVPGEGAIDTVIDTIQPSRDSGSGSSGSTPPRRNSPSRSPLPVTRVDSSNGRSIAEDRYRRGTDVIGSATRGLDKLRESLLPSAVAAERSSAPKKRLGPTDSFIAFQPDKIGDLKAKIGNPFANQRSPASVEGPNGLSSAASNTKAVVSVAGALTAGAAGTSDKKSSKEGGPKSVSVGSGQALANGANGSGGTRVGGAAGSSSAGANATAGKLAGLSKSKQDLLAGLFTRPYREIQNRLRQIEVVEALITSKIAVRDAQGRVLGSNRPSETYKFVSLEKPLQKIGQE